LELRKKYNFLTRW